LVLHIGEENTASALGADWRPIIKSILENPTTARFTCLFHMANGGENIWEFHHPPDALENSSKRKKET
jgi:hypothetical protein